MLTVFRNRKWPDLIAKANQRRCRAAFDARTDGILIDRCRRRRWSKIIACARGRRTIDRYTLVGEREVTN